MTESRNTWTNTELLGDKQFKIIVSYFNAALSVMDKTTRQKINMEIEYLNSTIDQLDIIDKYETLPPTQPPVYSFQVHTKQCPGHHMLSHKMIFKQFKRSCIIYRIRIQRNKKWGNHKCMMLNSIKTKVRKQNENTDMLRDKWKWKHTIPKLEVTTQ